MTKTLKTILFGLLMSAFCSAEAQTCTASGTKLNAATCNQADVQACFTAATSSTTVINIPACSGGSTWGSETTFTVPSGNTSLSILGAGSLTTPGGGDQTVIIDGSNSTSPILQIVTAAASSTFRIAGITFELNSGTTKNNGIVIIGGSSQHIRTDHVHFVSAVNSNVFQFSGCVYGVLDHSIFDEAAGSTSNSVRLYNQGPCYGDALGVGDQAWAHSTGLGGPNFMFVEDNVFNNGAGDDCTDGGSFVWRFNTMNTTAPAPSVQTHPTGGGGRIRGCRAWEVYQNQFLASNYINAALWMSSGTGVVWGNTAPGSSAGGGAGYQNFLELLSMRQSNSTYSESAPPNGWGYCGTAYNGTGSNWDQNLSASSGRSCLDQPGRGIGDLLTGGFTFDGSGSNNVTNTATGCTSSSPCAAPRQASEPIYEWMDNYSAVPQNPSNLVANSNPSALIANSDYYTWCSASSLSGCTSFNGTVGVGSGTLAARPSTCTTGVAYWATDQGSWNNSGSGGQGQLFKCTSTNTWTLFYTPYTYPHPLVASSPAPGIPVNPQATLQTSTTTQTTSKPAAKVSKPATQTPQPTVPKPPQ
jgi:hypothetical protein